MGVLEIDGKNLQRVMRELTRPFLDEEVEWRVDRDRGNEVSLLCYINSRAARNRLNEVLGPHNWQVQNECVMGPAPVFRAGVGILIRKEWVWKWDGAGFRSMHGSDASLHEAKAGFSDAFKRACACWGMGEHLYDLPNTKVQKFSSYPRGAPKHRVVKCKGGWAVAPSIRELQAELLTIEDLIAGIENPQQRRLARIDAVRVKMGWPDPRQHQGDGLPMIARALEAASAVWKDEVPTHAGHPNPASCSAEQLRIASHKLVDWYESGSLQEQLEKYGEWRRRSQEQPPEDPTQPPPQTQWEAGENMPWT